MRILTLIPLLVAAFLLQGCAVLGAGAAGQIVKRLELPAIAGVEAAIAADFEHAAVALAQATRPPTPAQAREILAQADRAMAGLELARLAYDATRGDLATPAMQAQILELRERTDEAYRALATRLVDLIALET